MKNNLPILKFVLIASWLGSTLACGSANQINVNSTNIANGNVNSTNVAGGNIAPTPLPTRAAPSNPKLPKDVCAYLSPELRFGDYTALSKEVYRCEARKSELFPSGKGASISYDVSGTAEYIRFVSLHLVVDGTAAEKLKWEKHFVETVEKLWQKAFAKPLPDEIKKQLEQDQGKTAIFTKKFEEPVETSIRRDAKETGGYYLKIEFYLDKNYVDKN